MALIILFPYIFKHDLVNTLENNKYQYNFGAKGTFLTTLVLTVIVQLKLCFSLLGRDFLLFQTAVFTAMDV